MSVFPLSSSRFNLPQSQEIVAMLEHQRLRYKFARRMLGIVGVANTLRAVGGRVARGTKAINMEQTKTAELRHPLQMTTRPSDVWSYDEIFGRHVYDLPSELDRHINGKTIVDLGAYIGIASSLFASRYPQSRIIAVEPHPRNQRYLEKNAAQYGGQIEVMRGAAAPNQEPIHMTVFGSDETNFVANYFGSEQAGKNVHEVIPITPGDILQKLGDDEIGILKVDIEGAEAALFGSHAIDPLLERTRILLIETHNRFVPGSEQAVQEAVARLGFTARQSRDEHTAVYANSRYL